MLLFCTAFVRCCAMQLCVSTVSLCWPVCVAYALSLCIGFVCGSVFYASRREPRSDNVHTALLLSSFVRPCIFQAPVASHSVGLILLSCFVRAHTLYDRCMCHLHLFVFRFTLTLTHTNARVNRYASSSSKCSPQCAGKGPNALEETRSLSRLAFLPLIKFARYSAAFTRQIKCSSIQPLCCQTRRTFAFGAWCERLGGRKQSRPTCKATELLW